MAGESGAAPSLNPIRRRAGRDYRTLWQGYIANLDLQQLAYWFDRVQIEPSAAVVDAELHLERISFVKRDVPINIGFGAECNQADEANNGSNSRQNRSEER